MNRIHFYSLIFILSLLGLSIFLYKVVVLGFPLNPEEKSEVWNVETRVTFNGEGKPAQISMFTPQSIQPYVVTTESFVGKNYGVTEKTEGPNRLVTWSTREADGVQILYYRGIIRQMKDWETDFQELVDPPPPVKESQGKLPSLEGAILQAGMALLAEVKDQSADMESLVLNLIRRLTKAEPDAHEALLVSQQPPEQAIAQVLTLHGTPARVVHGIELSREAKTVALKVWLEVSDQDQWVPFDLEQIKKGIPEFYLPWWRGDTTLFHIEGGTELEFRLSVSPNQEKAIQAAVARGMVMNPAWLKFSLFSLPVETQVVYHILILIPVGAFLLVILRNVVGLKTFGTFMPILIALAFRETQLLWGLVLFSVLIGLGLAVRFYLDHLKLLLVPRLAAVLIVVVLMMGALSIVSHHLGIVRGLSVALFPMVIVTMTIERMSIVWDERGPVEALQQAIGSLSVAALTYLLMSVQTMDYLFFTFPELLLILLAGTIALGRYTGYRLLEIRRFQRLLEPT